MQSTLTFCGGAGSVTGSNFLLQSEGFKTLVDCGLFQGCDFCEAANWKPFPYEPKSLPFLIVTHAHIDHVGRIPKLVRDGFRGRIISTEATKALAPALLYDSMELLRHDAQKHGREPLYDEQDVTQALALWEGVPYHQPAALTEGFSVELLDAGHILGSAMAKITRGGRHIIFTGDLGGTSILLPPRDSLAGANYLVLESVYGDRTHEMETETQRKSALERVIKETIGRGGTLLIPAFSTERTQEILFELRELLEEKRVPSVPVYLDSPLAEKMTQSFLAEPSYFKPELAARIKAGENIFSFPRLTFIENQHQSREVARDGSPKIIIAGSGMSNGGRVLSHERDILPEPNATLLIVGYQAAGSLGRQLLEGAKKVHVMGEQVAVHCRIESNFGYSAHLDGPHLIEAAGEAAGSLEAVFVVMGEPASAGYLAQHLHATLGVAARAPEVGESVTLNL